MKRVTLNLTQGSFEQGFPATLHIWDDCQRDRGPCKIEGRLPPALGVLTTFKEWEVPYCQLMKSRLTPIGDLPSNVSIPDLAKAFDEKFKAWLKSGDEEWQKIRECLLHNLDADEEILVIIETDDPDLRKLPWHLWDLFSDTYSKAEVVISAANYGPLSAQPRRNKPRLLAVLGNSTGINVEEDHKILKQFLDIDIKFLIEPKLSDLMDLLWQQSWDIFYFAGHSRSQLDGNSGFLWIQDSAVEMKQLRSGLKEAMSKGMRIAIFNSCDGLGLAKELADLHIPQVVVMREPVPDLVAQEFLKHFLKFFAAGQPLYLAVRNARSRLKEIEGSFPCASWLPALCQNPAELPLQPPKISWWRRSRLALWMGLAIAVGMIGIRQAGMLQSLEWWAFDRLQLLHPQERPDPRLLVVAVTEADIRRQGWPISDRVLGQLLTKLDSYQPQVIGLDIYRDRPVGEGNEALRPHFLNPKLIGVCAMEMPGQKEKEVNNVPAPSELPRERIGFSDVVMDDDGILRRHLLAMQPDVGSSCPTTEAFSFQLALHYLAGRGIQPELMSQGEYKIRNVLFKPLASQRGSYRTVDVRGYQVLLNYRSLPTPERVAQVVTLSDMLESHVDAKWFKDRVVLIGMTADSVPDNHLTPFSYRVQPPYRSPGVFIHAQMVSQVLSAVLDKRPLLWVWPDWAEGLWIVGWSVVGAGLAVWVRSGWLTGLSIGCSLVILAGLCWAGLLYGGWLPLIPAALALGTTGGSIVGVKTNRDSKHRRVKT